MQSAKEAVEQALRSAEEGRARTAEAEAQLRGAEVVQCYVAPPPRPPREKRNLPPPAPPPLPM